MDKTERYVWNKHKKKKFNKTKNTIVKYFKCSIEINNLLTTFSDKELITQSFIIQKALEEFFKNYLPKKEIEST